MAVDFKVEHTRTSEYLFLPEDITIKASLNGRHDAPDITGLKESILAHGQLQPVAVRNDGGKPVLVMGFSRWTAISEINKERRKAGEEPIKVRCVYVKLNDRDGFVANWHENHERNNTTPLDDAKFCAQLEKWGYPVKDIAEKLRLTEARVKASLALNAATPELQKAVHDGRVKPTAAAKIAKLAEEQQREAVKIRTDHSKVTAADVAAATGEPRKPSMKQLREMITEMADDTTEEKFVREFCVKLLAVMDGTAKKL